MSGNGLLPGDTGGLHRQAHYGNGNGEAQRFAAEWRQNVMEQQRAQAEINRTVAQSLTDITSAVATLKTAVDDLKKSPDMLRSMLGTYGGCLSQLLYATIASASLVASITAIVLTLTRH